MITIKVYAVGGTTLTTSGAVSFASNYVKTAGATPAVVPAAVAVTVTNTNGQAGDSYAVSTVTPPPSWLTCQPTHSAIGASGTDQLTCSVNSSFADTTPAGPQTATVHLALTSAGLFPTDTTFTVSLNITTTAPPLYSPNYPSVTLNYLVGGGANQSSVTTGIVAKINSVNTVYEPYTVNVPALPTWLSATAINYRANTTNPDYITFKVVPANVPTGSKQVQFTMRLAITGNPSEPYQTIVVTLNVTTSQLSSNGQSVPLTYTKGTGTGQLTNRVIILGAGVPFTLNIATVAPWLTATTAPSGGGVAYVGGTGSDATTDTVYFTLVNSTVSTMATGNYTANIGFSTTGYADLVVPVTLQISNGAATLSLQETSVTQSIVWGMGTPVPAPVWTPYSSNEPIPFRATCTVSVSDTGWLRNATWAAAGNVSPCSLNVAAALAANPPLPVSNTVTGVAFTTGYAITASLDPGLFASTLGNTVDVTVQIVQTAGGNGLIGKTYHYSLQPVNPKITSISPASVAVIPANTSTVVLVTGSNFVGSQSITPAALSSGSLVPTQVWLGNSTTPLSTGVVVVNSNQLQVTIPQSAFAQYASIPSGQTSAKLSVGIANQTTLAAPSGPTATTSLLVTTAPVVYAVTSTATYVMPTTLGGNPIVAPYELISIFGDNFGLNVLNPPSANAVLTAYNQVPTSLTISGSAVNKNLIALSATFKDAATGKTSFSAPIIYANQNQINAIVPSGLIAGTAAAPSTYNLTVTSGAATNVSTPICRQCHCGRSGHLYLGIRRHRTGSHRESKGWHHQ
ncbi:MAG: hypothetical protein WDO73_01110 [Ignavibacteriota bacterium]